MIAEISQVTWPQAFMVVGIAFFACIAMVGFFIAANDSKWPWEK